VSEYGLRVGTVEVGTAGPITFGPEGILFLADNSAAKIVALDVADPGPEGGSEPFDLEDLDARIGSLLGCRADDVLIRDLAVHPRTQNVYVSLQRGRGESAEAVLVRVDRLDGTVAEVPLTDVPSAETRIADAPTADDERFDVTLPLRGDEGEELKIGERTIRILRRPIRTSTVTDMMYLDGSLVVAGLSNEEFSSKLRRIPFPFDASTEPVEAHNLEIFHVSHGKWETAAPIRTFVAYDGGRSVLASYTCTPVVHFDFAGLDSGTKVIGRTVAELGAMNQPLDMVSFFAGGEEHLLVANTKHGLIKVSRADIDAQAPLTAPKEPVGVPRETEDLQGIVRLANLNDTYVLALQNGEGGRQHLRSLKTASL